ncbi:conjugal transfer protein TraM [Legionella sp.]|uniref:conjugal transfer protein TraM n=1 Tax=Legionella sp. TaxID=459 RepID=UPI000CBE2DC6|nr:conjugal transfer protein TraM [Legionella sp.]PJE14241.1 MAG: conjugal transfer protein TraM [Legionella sp.]
MLNDTETLIKEIAVKHGIAIGRDDPILILQTINTKLMEDSAKAQKLILDQYKEVLEEMIDRWGNDAKDKSERILNTSLSASKEAMINLSEDYAKAMAQYTKKELDSSVDCVNRELHKTERVAIFNITASIITFLAICIIIFGM